MPNEQNQPNYECKLHGEMKPDWERIADLSAGTMALRSKATIYSPQFPKEPDDVYADRAASAVLYPAFSDSVEGLVGLVFRKDPQLADDVPQRIKDECENIDLMGTHWTVFAKEVFDWAVRFGHSLIYVDMPPALPLGATQADEQAVSRRAYWLKYKPEQIVNWRMKPEERTIELSTGAIVMVKTGRMKLDLLVLRECTREEDGEYGETEVVRYRVLRPGSWQLFVEEDGGQNKEKTYTLEGEGTTGLDEIPVSIIYGCRLGYLHSRPPLQDLALMNLRHYAKQSDYDGLVHICSVPIFWTRDEIDESQTEAVSAHAKVKLGPNGAVGYAEPSGVAIESARQLLTDAKAEMAQAGFMMLVDEGAQVKTATQSLIDSSERTSKLSSMAKSLHDAVEQALFFHGQYEGIEMAQRGSITMGTAMDDLILDVQEVQSYSTMVKEGQLSLRTVWAILERAGKLPDDFDMDAELEQIKKEREMLTPPELQPDNTGQGVPGAMNGQPADGMAAAA